MSWISWMSKVFAFSTRARQRVPQCCAARPISGNGCSGNEVRPKTPTHKRKAGWSKKMESRHREVHYTHETAPTQSVEASGIRYAYRRFGKPGTIPLLFLEYFNSNMDGWDPDVANSLAADHEVILFDNAGVGTSGGKTPNLVAEMTKHCVAFCRGLGLKQIHVVGFSLGGMIAQQLALEHSALVGRLILLGTGPRGGEDMTFTELSPDEQADPVAFLLAAFFSPSEASQAAGHEYLKRIESRKKDGVF